MAEYERMRLVLAAPDAVFAFLSDIRNLPTYVATVQSVEVLEEGRVRIRDTSHRGPYEDLGWFRHEPTRLRLEWSADEHDYSGWLSVAKVEGGSQVFIHLSIPPMVTASDRPLTGELALDPDPYEQSLEAALDSLRQLREGTGGKEQPAATT